jgi:hypothetical protein
MMSYADLRLRANRLPVVASEIPVGHAYSLPIPTLRFGAPGIAAFAAPADRTGGELRQFPPDRWWVVDATTGRLAFYALIAAVPLAAPLAALDADAWGPLEIPPPAFGLDELEQRLAAIDAIMSVSAARFWRGLEAEHGEAIAAALGDVIPAQLLPVYRALAADFWTWLGQ